MIKSQTKIILSLLQKAVQKFNNHLHFLKSTEISNSIRNELHNQVFQEINCLDCANCCRTTPAIVTTSDIKRIAKHLGLSKKRFERNYLLDDLTGDIVLNHVPCKFLNEDHTCSIYEVRPTACRRYPHTDENAFNKRPSWNTKNTLVCPAAYLIVERLHQVYHKEQ